MSIKDVTVRGVADRLFWALDELVWHVGMLELEDSKENQEFIDSETEALKALELYRKKFNVVKT